MSLNCSKHSDIHSDQTNNLLQYTYAAKNNEKNKKKQSKHIRKTDKKAVVFTCPFIAYHLFDLRSGYILDTNME